MDAALASAQTIEHWTRTPTTRSAWPASLLGIGSCAPRGVVTNEYFVDELQLDTSAKWIQDRTGIVERRHASPTLHTSQLAAEAARVALDRARIDPQDVDLIVVATSTPDYTMPATASLVQQQLGATRAAAFDVSSACAGFIVACDIAARYLQTGLRNVVVIGADLGSRLVSFEDRGTCIFFGDGAGAIVMGAGGAGRILASRVFSAGNAVPLSVPVGGAMTMDGRAIWDFATRVLPETVRALCREANIRVEDIKLLVPHQANRNILEAAAKELGLPLDRVAMNLQRYGNTLAASIPLALDEALDQGRAQPGDVIALVGFGAGLAWGGMLWQL